jgi:hypothetical protein
MNRPTIIRTVAVGATCALAGAGAGIAEGSASTNHTTKERVAHAARGRSARAGAVRFGPAGGPAFAIGIPGGAAGPPVHSESVVPNEKGGFDTVTMDRGTFSSLSGEQLTITEGTKSATYKTVTLTIPSDATVYRNGEKATLADIKAGDTVTVVQTPSGTFVNAFDAEHEPKLQAHKSGEGPGPLMKKAGEGPPPQGAGEGPAGEGSSSAQATEGSSSN